MAEHGGMDDVHTDHDHTHEHEAGLPFRDEALALLVELLDLQVSFGVSVLVGGTWVTGVAISGRQWFREVAEAVRGGAPAEASDAFAGAVAQLGDSIYGPLADASLPIGFIHLKAARPLTGEASGPEGAGLVRLRLDRVEGWSLGELTSATG